MGIVECGNENLRVTPATQEVKSVVIDFPSWMRLIASARRGAQLTVCTFGPLAMGTESVVMIS